MPKVRIDNEKCISCQTCVGLCPMGVYEVEGDKVVVAQEEQCIICRACEAACPVDAVTVED